MLHQAAESRIAMTQAEKSPNDRIARLGEQLIQVLEHEEDHAVVLSALALVTAAGCSSLAGEESGALKAVAEGFVRTFRGIIARDTAMKRVVH
jgi:hypothetical protein